ncbi:MAG: efflux RND transporter permease subunit [Alphaproteobacteria bacterium]|nr:efflux RND transporter permease subunit [Alphaproteobacteria bacterium]
MTTLFFRFKRLTILTIILLIAAGLGAFFSLGRQEDPTLVERFGFIVTTYPGASAERIEALITEPIENAINELAEIDEMNSTSRANVSALFVSLREDLTETEVDQAWSLVRQQVDAVTPLLPAGAGAPDIQRQYVGAATMIVALSWDEYGDENVGILSRLGRDLERQLLNLSGTEETLVFGDVEEEIRVQVEPEALASLGLTVADLAALTASADSRSPGGRVRADNVNLTVEIDGAFDSIDRIRDIALAESPDGSFVRLGDIADVEKAYQDPPDSMALHNGQRSVFVAAYLQPDLRADLWALSADALVAEFATTVPGIQVETIFRQGDYVESRLNGLARNLGYSALIVFGVLFVMMGWRAAFIVGAALPFTVLSVMLMFRLYDEPLHQMSVTGLVVALGLLIDNAIVVVEEYRLLRSKGQTRLEALDGSIRILFAPLLASTMTTVFAFAPIALMPGAAGEFIGMIGISVIFAIISSFVIAMTLIGALAAWFDDPKAADGPKRFWRTGLNVPPLAWLYRGVLRTVIARPWIGVLGSILLPIAGFMAASTLPMQFFPPTDRDMFQVEMVLPSSASIEETRRYAERLRGVIESYDGVEQVSMTLGDSPPRTYYNVFGSESGVSSFAAGFVKTESAAATARILPQLQREVMTVFPEARILTLPYEQGPPVPAPIELIIVGPELGELNRLGNEIRGLLANTPSVTYTVAQLELGEPVARVMADEASAELAGLRLSQLAGQLRGDLDGVIGGSVLEGIEELPVRIIANDDSRSSLRSVSATPVGARGGDVLATPVAALGEVDLEPQVALIPHEEGLRVNKIFAYLDPFTLPSAALASFLESLEEADINLPPGYELQIGGEAEERGDAVGNLLGTAVPLIVLMIGSVVLAFNSFRYGFVILFVAFLSVGLAMFGVWLFGTPLGFNAIVGSMGLMGLAINGAIVVLSALKTDPAARALEAGAVEQSVTESTRHILSTTMTTIGGFMPLLLSGESFWLPFAAAMVGGVAGSAILALIFAPAAFVLLARGEIKRDELVARVKQRARERHGLLGAAK